MTFTEPLDFNEALEELRAKELLPTGLSSAELQALDADVRLHSLFSARTTAADYLQELRETLGDFLNGDTNLATARARLQDQLDELGYDAEAGGFPGDESIPPAERGSLRDLASDERVDLVLQTNARQTANRAYQRAGQTDYALYAFPALELVRVYPRVVPRGYRRVAKGALVPDPGNDWPSRWADVGGRFYGDGRMIARKDDDIWQQIGSSANFSDALDSDVPPFAFGSGFGVRQVSREECIALGVIGANDVIEGRTSERIEVRQELAKFDTDFLKQIVADLDVSIDEGAAKLRASGDLSAPLLALGPEVRL